MICFSFFFFNDTATTEIYTLSLHDALPIGVLEVKIQLVPPHRPRWAHHPRRAYHPRRTVHQAGTGWFGAAAGSTNHRSEEHTSELQSHLNLVCRLLLEKKKKEYTDALVTHR